MIVLGAGARAKRLAYRGNVTTPTPDTPPRVGERSLARGVRVTWWYTFGGIVAFGLASVAQWVIWMFRTESGDLVWRLLLAGLATLFALAGMAMLLRSYRPSVLTAGEEGRRIVRRADLLGLGPTAIAAVLFGLATGSWLAGVGILAYGLSVRPWLHGVRWKVNSGLTLVLIALMIAEAHPWDTTAAEFSGFLIPAIFALLLPVISGSSLWWWDIVLELDRARQAESLLSATRERLRLANDVHDLQGHHLQVIALQLELAQRLMDRDPDAAAIEIARAREAVDAARQGTRDLAAQFRGVPLPDELENAADLLRSAGIEVQSKVDADVSGAPVDVLGPIVRESVTNVLKHGGGRWASLSLDRLAEGWRYRVANDDGEHDDLGWGSGLEGMRERAEASGGDVTVSRDGQTFEFVVVLPGSGAERMLQEEHA